MSLSVLEKTLESPLNCKEIQPVSTKGNESWIFNGRTDIEAEAPILWPPDGRNWLVGKGPDAGKDWRQEQKGTTEDQMVGWHHWLDGHDFEQLQELVMDREVWCITWGRKDWLNWTEDVLIPPPENYLCSCCTSLKTTGRSHPAKKLMLCVHSSAQSHLHFRIAYSSLPLTDLPRCSQPQQCTQASPRHHKVLSVTAF